eukprot:6657141-Prymnesium_polylepis.1
MDGIDVIGVHRDERGSRSRRETARSADSLDSPRQAWRTCSWRGALCTLHSGIGVDSAAFRIRSAVRAAPGACGLRVWAD